jgi:hypothetical protein
VLPDRPTRQRPVVGAKPEPDGDDEREARRRQAHEAQKHQADGRCRQRRCRQRRDQVWSEWSLEIHEAALVKRRRDDPAEQGGKDWVARSPVTPPVAAEGWPAREQTVSLHHPIQTDRAAQRDFAGDERCRLGVGGPYFPTVRVVDEEEERAQKESQNDGGRRSTAKRPAERRCSRARLRAAAIIVEVGALPSSPDQARRAPLRDGCARNSPGWSIR